MSVLTIAYPHCYGCLGTGRTVGFGHDGEPCSCVAECRHCEVEIAWGHDDEYAPLLCNACATDRAIWETWHSGEFPEEEYDPA